MMMFHRCCAATLVSALLLGAPSAYAQLGDMLGGGGNSGSGGMGGLGGGGLGGMGGGGLLPGQSMTAGTTGNAAGVLSFCIKNNYLGGGTEGIRDNLMGKIPGQQPKSDPGYLDGAQGILDSGNGNRLDLNTVGNASPDLKKKITKQACDQVLKQSKSIL